MFYNETDSLRYLSGPLSKLPTRFNLQDLEKGTFPHRFVKFEHFNYVGEVPDDSYYLKFGQIHLDSETALYLQKLRSSGQSWSFSNELLKYTILDVEILRKSVERYLEQNFEFQNKLMNFFGRQNPSSKLPHIHAFTKPYLTLASYSYALLRAYGTAKTKNNMFCIMNPLGKHTVRSSHEEYQYCRFLETQYEDILHGWNSKDPLPRFCNSVADAISYKARTLFYYHGCVIHGDIFRPDKPCPLMNCNITPNSKNPFGWKYADLHEKFELLKENILKKHGDIIDNIHVEWSCDFQNLKRTVIKDFIKSLPLQPNKRLIPREAVRGGRCDTFFTYKDANLETQLFYKDANSVSPVFFK